MAWIDVLPWEIFWELGSNDGKKKNISGGVCSLGILAFSWNDPTISTVKMFVSIS